MALQKKARLQPHKRQVELGTLAVAFLLWALVSYAACVTAEQGELLTLLFNNELHVSAHLP